MDSPSVTADVSEALTALKTISDPKTEKMVLEAAGRAARSEAVAHFRERDKEGSAPPTLPFEGRMPKRHFWIGVSRAVANPLYDPGDGSVLIRIDSPALAHRANPNPPLIRPKGGRQFLAIPANARAASWDAMPRDAVSGGARFLRPTRDERGRRYNARQLAASNVPIWWLVKSVQTKHDPRAMPDEGRISAAANEHALKTLDLLVPDTSATSYS